MFGAVDTTVQVCGKLQVKLGPQSKSVGDFKSS